MKNIFKNKASIYIVVGILCAGFFLLGFYLPRGYSFSTTEITIHRAGENKSIQDDYENLTMFLLSKECDKGFISSNVYGKCLERVIKELKDEKSKIFTEIQDKIKTNPNVFVVNTGEFESGLMDWYNTSDQFNEKRCKAEDVWAMEASGYDEGVTECRVFETNRDLLLLKDLKENINSKILY